MSHRIILPLIFCILGSVAFGETRVASWNIRNLGWENGKDYAALANVGGLFDFIAVQEVMNESGINQLEAALEARTGADWDRLCSHAIGAGSYKEMYCFTWRTDKIFWVEGATVYLDDRDVFAREPFSAVFETDDQIRFLAASIHAIYGEDVAGREAEANALRGYHDWLHDSFPGLPVLLMGDFNLPPTNPAWAPLGEVAHPLIQNGATTISSIDGRFANLYDNIWVDVEVDLPVSSYGKVEFPHQLLGISHEAARESVSDHIPVYVILSAERSERFAPLRFAGTRGRAEWSAPPISDVLDAGGSAPIIGNARSKIYHLPGCPSYSAVGERNRKVFATESEAIAAGFRRAGNC